jgi:hypothetical protein
MCCQNNTDLYNVLASIHGRLQKIEETFESLEYNLEFEGTERD